MEQKGVKPQGFRVVPVPVFKDNFAYLLIDKATGITCAVDPADADLVKEAVDREVKADKNITLTHVLTTHKHADHAGGNDKMVTLFKDLVVVGGQHDKVQGMTLGVSDGDSLQIGGTTVDVMHTPCHTRGHVLYVVSSGPDQPKALFSGDTLFIGGCGRFFEGDAKEMHAAMQRIAKLPASTQVYCGHEYTVSNFKFALHVAPKNEDIQKKYQWAQDQVKAGRHTVPSTVADELKTNVFMRTDAPEVQKFASSQDPIEVMRVLRNEKNSFQG